MVKTVGKKEITESIKLTPVAAPSAETGKIYFDSGDSQLKVHDGAGFRRLINLDATSKLPAIDGSQLTNLPAVNPFKVTTLTDATEYSVTGTTWTTVKTFTFTPPTTEHFLMMIKWSGEMKADSASTAQHGIRIDGGDYGVFYVKRMSIATSTSYVAVGAQQDVTAQFFASGTATSIAGDSNDSLGYLERNDDTVVICNASSHVRAGLHPLHGKTSYSILIRVRNATAAKIAYLKNVVVKIYYLDSPATV